MEPNKKYLCVSFSDVRWARIPRVGGTTPEKILKSRATKADTSTDLWQTFIFVWLGNMNFRWLFFIRPGGWDSLRDWCFLVSGWDSFNPIEKIFVKIGTSSPIFGVKIKNICNQQPVFFWFKRFMYRPTIQGYSINFQLLGRFLVVEGLTFHQHVIFSQGSIFLKTNVEDT